MSRAVLFETLNTLNGKKIGIAKLNAEKTLNALSLDMVDLLYPQLLAWSDDQSIVLVVLEAAGEKAFCAGGDLQNLYQAMLEHHATDQRSDIRANQYACDFFEREYRLDYLIHSFPKPILCWAHGIVMGGGIGLMAGASHRVVTERSRLAMPEVNIGLFPDVGGSWFLSRIADKLGLFLALTGTPFNAADAKFVGMADYAIAHANKAAVFDALLAQQWGTNAADNSALLNVVLSAAENGLQQEAGPLAQHAVVIKNFLSGGNLVQIIDKINSLSTDDAWLQRGIAALKTASPGSMALSYLLQQRAQQLSLADVFRLEYVVALHCAANPDFAEGIRARLIDKDNQPQWKPSTLLEASADWAEGFFADPWSADAHPLADLGKVNIHSMNAV